jgi:hypothetical protein
VALAEVHHRVLEDPEEGAGHIAVDHIAAGVDHIAAVAGRRRTVVRVDRTVGAVGRKTVGVGHSRLAAGVLVDKDLLSGCLVVGQEHESQLERVLGIFSICDNVGWKQ